MTMLRDVIDRFNEKKLGHLIYLSYAGSVLHGTDNEESDLDIRGLYLPTLENLILEKESKAFKYTFEKYDVVLFSVQKFLMKMLSMEINALELLFSMYTDKTIFNTNESYLIKTLAPTLLTKNYGSFYGLAQNAKKNYENGTVDIDDMLHAIRCCHQAKQIQELGRLTYPVPCTILLKSIKSGEIDIDGAYQLLSVLMKNENIARQDPSAEQYLTAEKLILDLYKDFNRTL